jgi:hypothetical protein
MRTKPLSCFIASLVGSVLSTLSFGQEAPELPTQKKMPLSILNDMGKQKGLGVLLASTTNAGCRNFAMATSTSFGLPVWDIVLYTGELRDKILDRVLWVTSIQNIASLKFEGDMFKAITAERGEVVLSFRTRDCGG